MEDGHFNPYYDGGIIAMAPPLYTDIIEYTDGELSTEDVDFTNLKLITLQKLILKNNDK